MHRVNLAALPSQLVPRQARCQPGLPLAAPLPAVPVPTAGMLRSGSSSNRWTGSSTTH